MSTSNPFLQPWLVPNAPDAIRARVIAAALLQAALSDGTLPLAYHSGLDDADATAGFSYRLNDGTLVRVDVRLTPPIDAKVERQR